MNKKLDISFEIFTKFRIYSITFWNVLINLVGILSFFRTITIDVNECNGRGGNGGDGGIGARSDNVMFCVFFSAA